MSNCYKCIHKIYDSDNGMTYCLEKMRMIDDGDNEEEMILNDAACESFRRKKD